MQSYSIPQAARVNGIIQERLYEEGTDVEVGTPLFQIDPRETRANLKAAKAALERAEEEDPWEQEEEGVASEDVSAAGPTEAAASST